MEDKSNKKEEKPSSQSKGKSELDNEKKSEKEQQDILDNLEENKEKLKKNKEKINEQSKEEDIKKESLLLKVTPQMAYFRKYYWKERNKIFTELYSLLVDSSKQKEIKLNEEDSKDDYSDIKNFNEKLYSCFFKIEDKEKESKNFEDDIKEEDYETFEDEIENEEQNMKGTIYKKMKE